MSRTVRVILLLGLFAFVLGSAVQAGIVRVGKRYNVLDIYGGYTSPLGSYDGIVGLDFLDTEGRSVTLEADEVYDPSFYFGIDYGQLRNDHILFTGGFRYVKIDQLEGLVIPEPDINRYDLDFNVNYLFLCISDGFWTPYLGLGLQAGFTTMSSPGFASDSRIGLTLGANFGLEVKLWESPSERSFVTLASVNSYDFYGSGDRAKFFNVGFGVKYYYRP